MKSLMTCFLLFAFGFTARATSSQPNILLFLVDDMGVMDSSLPSLADENGNPVRHPLNERYRTPNMERLAALGTRFERFYANSVCSPTRISILTGQTSARHRSTQWIRPESNNAGEYGDKEWNWKGLAQGGATLPVQLHKAGYHTILCGKAHLGPFQSTGQDPVKVGFDQNIAGTSIGAPGSYYGTDDFGNKKGGRSRGVPGLKKYHGQDIHLTEALTLELKDALTQTVKSGKPFFAYMAHYAVHAPFQDHKKFLGNYPELKGSPRSFATMIEGMDASLGALLDHLDTLGIAENTLVIFLGDNGSDAPLGHQHAVACAAPLRGKKGAHYEGGMRVPFIAAWAKPNAELPIQKSLPIQAGALTRELGNVTDIMPTLATLCGIQVDTPVDGTNLAPILAGGKRPAAEDHFLMHFPHEHRSNYFTVYTEGPWKVVYHYRKPEAERYELFQLQQDPYESNNLAAEKPDELKRMMGGLIHALDEAGAGYPLADDKTTLLKPVRP